MLYEVTIEEPEIVTDAWRTRMPLYRCVEEDIWVLEYECYSLAEDQRVD